MPIPVAITFRQIKSNVTIGVEIPIQFNNEGVKTVTIVDSRIKANTIPLGSLIRQTVNPNPGGTWFIVNVINVQLGQMTILIVPLHEQGNSVRVASYTGTVNFGCTLS